MPLIIISILFAGLCYKFANWENWYIYYPTITFYIIVSLTSHIVTYNISLWSIPVLIGNDSLSEYYIVCFIFPSIILLFLSNYPKQPFKKIAYLFSFVFILSLIEYVSYLGKYIFYGHGWTIGWSILLYIGMFMMIRLHYKKPLFAWLLFFPIVVAGMLYFNISLNDLK